MEQPEQARETLAKEAEQRVTRPECPFCGEDSWTLGDDVAVVYYAGDILLGGPLGEGFGALPFACSNCGFIRFHAEKSLQREGR